MDQGVLSVPLVVILDESLSKLLKPDRYWQKYTKRFKIGGKHLADSRNAVRRRLGGLGYWIKREA